MECPNLIVILILLNMKSVLFYITNAIQESSFSYKSEDDLLSSKRYKRSGSFISK